MLRKVVLLLVLAGGLALSSGCSPQTGFSPTQNLRRLMIVGEQLRLVHQDIDRTLMLEDYPIGGRYTH